MSRLAGWWRHAALAGLVAGLLASPRIQAPPGWLVCMLAAAAALAAVGRDILVQPRRAGGLPLAGWLGCLCAIGALTGLGVGSARVEAIDGGALDGPVGRHVELSGFVDAVPRRSFGEVRVPLATPAGRVMLVAPEPVQPLPVGRRVEVSGRLAEADPFHRDELERLGTALELRADDLELSDDGRGGITGLLDRIRSRAETGLQAGMDEGESALARGFVLGEDDLIDPVTRDAFKRSGLAHLLAVSGQNVMLLAILAGVIFGAFGVRLRARLILTMALIAIYVPVAGGGPSIQRAGVMGAAAILATLAGRPSDRAYLALLAGAVTLIINPRFGTDVGWQLSFAAVVGIMLWAAPLRLLLLPHLSRWMPERIARPLAEGAGLTIAATLATAPLMAHYFEQLSLAAIPANLIVLVAIAPVMWIGMLVGLLAQLPALPLAPLGGIEGVLIDFVRLVAEAFAAPSWAQAKVPLSQSPTVVAAYIGVIMLVGAALKGAGRRRGLGVPRRIALAGSLLALAVLGDAALDSGPGSDAPPPATLRITELDVGQGDATLLEPARGAPILVDGGPPGGAAADALDALGIDRLRAVFVTHDQLDHAGGLFEVLASTRVEELVHALPAPELDAAARGAGTRVVSTAEGSSFDFGRLDLDVLWPPRDPAPAGEDPNLESLVMVARYGGYDALLTGDAESEATHLDPGPIDVLKVAHHGSDDAGLDDLLDRSVPRIALIGVGADNGYGHPTPATIGTLAEHGVCILRTDLDGASTVELGPAGVRAWSADGDLPADRPGCSSQIG